jgi:hypothetical protein
MTKKRRSKVLKWAEARKQPNQNAPPLEILSDSTIYGITRFALPHPNIDGERDPLGERLYEGASKVKISYSNDSSLFELGCYVYFRVDLWHFRNGYLDLREKVLNFCIDEFISVFQNALGFDYGNKIFLNRIDLYAKLMREENVERIDFYLVQLMLRTKNNALPEVYDFDQFPIVITDCFEEL